MILRKGRAYLVSLILVHVVQQANARVSKDMHVAFNYGQATGSAQLLRFITEHTEVKLQFLSIPVGHSFDSQIDRSPTALSRLAMYYDCRQQQCLGNSVTDVHHTG